MAPTAAMALNGIAPAGLIGRAVPLAFLVRDDRRDLRLLRVRPADAATSATPGRSTRSRARRSARAPASSPAGRCSATYLAFTVAVDRPRSACSARRSSTAPGSGRASTGSGSRSSPARSISLLAYGDVKVATRALLAFEGISVALIVILDDRHLREADRRRRAERPGLHARRLQLPAGTSLGAVASAAVFGFLSFGGFEGAAALGEETNDPRRNIPRAIAAARRSSAASSTSSCILAQTLRLRHRRGRRRRRSRRRARRSATCRRTTSARAGGRDQPRRDDQRVRERRSAPPTAASRILFALGRDGFGTRPLGDASQRTGRAGRARSPSS